MRKGIFPLVAAAFVWSWPNVMIRMLRTDFDVFTQSFFRYVAASVFLFAVGLIFARRRLLDGASNLKMLLIPALIMAVHQMFFTAGIFMTSAIVSSLMGRLNAIIIPVLSCIFYEDERRVVGNRNFLMGAFLAFLGVGGVILGRGAAKVDGFNLGTVFVIIGTLGWSVYAVYIKKVVRSIDPLAIIAFVSLLSVLFFLPVVLIFGDIGRIAYVSTGKRMVLFGSGILGVGIGNVFYYHAVKHVGTSISSIFFLLLPLSVGVIAFLVLGETLTVVQIVSGIVLVFGCFIVTRLAKKTRYQAVKQPGSANAPRSILP
jgi:drug/metabolite transporter (DMT)-like permease